MQRQTVKNLSVALILILVSFINSTTGFSQATPADSLPEKKWNFLLEPYIMFAGMKGTMGVGNLPDVDVDESASDIFENLKFGSMLYAEMYNKRWAFSSDLIYMKLAADLTPVRQIVSGEAEAEQFAWELAALRSILGWLEGGIGLQLNVMKSELDIHLNTSNGPVTRSGSLKETWVDPYIIARVKLPVTSRLLILVRPSIGGFGIGSDLAWQVQAHATYRFTRVFQLSLGYRVIGTDYKNGSGSDRFLYDINSFGPVLRFGFHL